MKKIEGSGTALILGALAILFFLLNSQTYKLTPAIVENNIEDSSLLEYLQPALEGMQKKEFHSKAAFVSAYQKAVTSANEKMESDDNSANDDEQSAAEDSTENKDAATQKSSKNDTQPNKTEVGKSEIKANGEHATKEGAQPARKDEEQTNSDQDYSVILLMQSAKGPVKDHTIFYLTLIVTMFTLGSLLLTYGKYGKKPAGIKNDGVFKKPLTSVKLPAIIVGLGLIIFYIILYWYPYLLSDWILLVNPIKQIFKSGYADENFLYGFIYSLAVLLFGIKMFVKYRHSNYQMIRTGSVTFFQLSFAFIIPEILSFLKKPSVDLKNIWPLDYSFFFGSNITELISNGKIGVFMLVWGIALLVIAVPLFTYFFGKRWYCSWVCGCGGLAETAGDPFRHLSSKKLVAWKIERLIIYSVLVITVGMTAITLTNYFSNGRLLGDTTEIVEKWYGFMIGSVFAGVIGTGMYPIMGNRVWCRFGCPLAAIFGIIQRYKSRFRITTNGGQCISCGNCSTYCEMGIDVRWYAQRQQNIVRSSCVGCGICAEVCPRGVLKLENGKEENRINSNPIIIGNDKINVIL